MSGSRATADNFEDMFSNMPGMEDDNEADDTSSTQSDDTSTQSEGAEHQGQRTDRSTGEGGREDAHGQTTEDPNRIVRRQDGLVERQSQTDPRRRDLVDPVTGQIVAQGGIERRVYEQAKRNEREANALRAEVQQLRAHTQGMQQANTVATQLGLQPDVQITAMRVMADFMKDPVRTIEYLIAEVKGKGYNIPSLQGAPGTDMEALAKLIDQRLQPITSRYQQEQQLTANHQRAQRDLDNFLADMPDARANLDIIAEMITGDNSLTLDRAYTRFVQWCSANQLDPTQHVGPQLQYRQQQQQVAPPGAQPRQATRPLPGNRQLNGSSIPVNSRVIHDADADWSSIIAESMSDAGMR